MLVKLKFVLVLKFLAFSGTVKCIKDFVEKVLLVPESIYTFQKHLLVLELFLVNTVIYMFLHLLPFINTNQYLCIHLAWGVFTTALLFGLSIYCLLNITTDYF